MMLLYLQQQGSSVPQFGAWGSGESTPNYTTIFNQAREDRVTGKKVNPNEPQQNQDMFPNTTGTSVEPEPIRKGVDNTGRRAAGDQSPHHRHGARGGGSGGRHVRQNNAESQHSSDRSPRHPSKTKSSIRGDETVSPLPPSLDFGLPKSKMMFLQEISAENFITKLWLYGI